VRLLDWKSRRERIVRRSSEWRSHGLAISLDGQMFALADTFMVSHQVGYKALAIDKETTFIEIRESKNGTKTASLRLDSDGADAMAFAPDNSVLYFTQGNVQRWPRSQWKIGVVSTMPHR